MQDVFKFIFNLLIDTIKIIFNIPTISETKAILIFITTGGIITIIGILALIQWLIKKTNQIKR